MPQIDGDTHRLFIGVPVTANARQSIVALLPGSLPGRMVSPNKWHFTLRFLGSTETTRIPSLLEALGKMQPGKSFNVGFSGLGAFPGPGRARVLWVGVDKGKAELEGLARRVESAVERAGFPSEKRAFKAHLTICRIRPPASIAEAISKGGAIRVSMPVDSLILYRSRLGGETSSYEEVSSFALRG